MKIASIRTTPILAPLPRPVRTASGTIDQFPLVLIDVVTDDGVAGRAYAQVYLPELLPALERTVAGLAGMITGMPLAPRAVHAFLLRRCRLFGLKGLTGVALGGLDMALWDTWARARGEPLARALGAELRPLKAYNSVGLYDARAVVAIAEETRAAGYAGLKIKAGFATLAEDLAAVRAARRALGDGIALMIDYNQSLGVAEAMARCRALDGEGLEWIEEPVLADDLEGCARIADAVVTPPLDRRELPWSVGDARRHRREGHGSGHAGPAVHPRGHRLARGGRARAHGRPAHVVAHVRRGERAPAVRDPDGALARGAGCGGRPAPRTAGVVRRDGDTSGCARHRVGVGRGRRCAAPDLTPGPNPRCAGRSIRESAASSSPPTCRCLPRRW